MNMHNNTTNKPRTAVVILNWNGEKLLQRFLPGVIAGTPAAQGRVIVVDNGSTDGSRQYLESQEVAPHISTIYFDQNLGFAEGYNQALQRLEGQYEYAVLLNSDVDTPEGWLEPLVEFMDAHPRTGAVQPKLLSVDNRTQFEYAGASGGFIDKNGYPYCRGRIFSQCETDSGQYDKPLEIFWATGASLMVRLDLYLKVGGLDPRFFAHMEEIDLCWRIHLAGYDIYAVPQSHVYHLGGGSLPASNPRKTYLNFRNNLLLLHKNLPDSSRGKTLLKRRLLDTIAWAKFIASLDFKNASAIIHAHRDFRKMAPGYTQHPQVDLLKTFPGTQTNILMQHFVRRKTKFSQLN